MSAAAFVLAINLFVAGVFAIAFATLAAYARSGTGTRWLAAGYGLGVVTVGLEFILPLQTDPRLVGIGIFLSFLGAISLCVVGLARHFRVAPPWRTLIAINIASLAMIVFVIDMPRTSLLRATLYQLPYFVVQVIGAFVVLRKRRREGLDLVLLALYLLSAINFMTKPLMAAAIGSGASPQDYMASTYAAISQATAAVLLVSNGMLLLLIIVRDSLAEVTARSETDKLSGLLNRRGFEDQANQLLATTMRAGVPGAMVVADLDHFKHVNDSHGHEAGDRVIVGFADILADMTSPRAVIGRLGGEEFAIFLPGENLETAGRYAEAVRTRFAGTTNFRMAPDLVTTASFGVTQLRPGDTLSDLLRRADAALYQAKHNGRDQVASLGPDLMERLSAEPKRDRRNANRQR